MVRVIRVKIVLVDSGLVIFTNLNTKCEDSENHEYNITQNSTFSAKSNKMWQKNIYCIFIY